MITLHVVIAIALFGQFLDQTDSHKGQTLTTCTLLGGVTEAVIDVRRADKTQPTYDVVVEFDGTKADCPLRDDAMPETANCGKKVAVRSGTQDKSTEHIAIFATPSKISITLSEKGHRIATQVFEPIYESYYPNGKDCPPEHLFWRAEWLIPGESER